MLRSARNAGYDSKQADVWSSGVMLYAMLFCCYPFDRREDQDDPRAYAKITQRIFKGARQALSYAVWCVASGATLSFAKSPMRVCQMLHKSKGMLIPLLVLAGGGVGSDCIPKGRASVTQCVFNQAFPTAMLPSKASGLTCYAVCAADYELPASKPVSAECKDILSRILVVDPAKRINIKEIQVSFFTHCAGRCVLRCSAALAPVKDLLNAARAGPGHVRCALSHSDCSSSVTFPARHAARAGPGCVQPLY